MNAREIRSFDYVNQPYEHVSRVLADNAAEVLRNATRAATSRGQTVAAELKLDLSGIAVSAEIELDVQEIERLEGEANRTPQTRIRIGWQAANRPHLFPFMDADLLVYPLTRSETQLDFNGAYTPPFGRFGATLDAIAGRRIAEACVHRFVHEVASYLREMPTTDRDGLLPSRSP